MKIIFELDIKESWKKIRGWPYKISNYGSVKRSKKGINTYIGKIKKHGKNRGGYLVVNLCKNGKYKTFSVHRLVAEAFIGSCPKNKEVNHKDGDKENPHIGNLEYVTRSENHKHAFKLGLKKHNGEYHPRSKLKEKDVEGIKKLYKIDGKTQQRIAEMFDVTVGHVSKIINNKIWI